MPLSLDTLLILAGGQSSRFGRPKALVDIAGKPMVRRVFDSVGSLAAEVVVSVADSRMAENLAEALPGAVFAVDRRRAMGPIEGILRGFEMAQGERILVAPCDAPLIRPGLYRLLLDSLGDREAAVPRFDVLDPVRAVYRKAAVMRVLDRSPSVPSPSALVDRLRTVFVAPDRIRGVDPDLSSFFDVNTRDDLAEALRRVHSRKD